MQLENIHVAHWGASGPRVILVHGGVQGSQVGGERNFAYQKPLADAGWQLLVPDRPGHGRSPDPGRPDDAEADGAWVATLVGEGAHLVGHSFGGCVALAATVRRPQAIHSLTLVEPAMLKLAIADGRVGRFLIRLAAAQIFAVSPARRAIRVMDVLGIPAETRDRANTAEMARLGQALRRAVIPSKTTLERELGLIRQAGVPLLVISGGWSGGFDATAARVAAVGGGRHVVVASPHHFTPWAADAFNAELVAFMSASEGART